jgi:hypothetical protein
MPIFKHWSEPPASFFRSRPSLESAYAAPGRASRDPAGEVGGIREAKPYQLGVPVGGIEDVEGGRRLDLCGVENHQPAPALLR